MDQEWTKVYKGHITKVASEKLISNDFEKQRFQLPGLFSTMMFGVSLVWWSVSSRYQAEFCWSVLVAWSPRVVQSSGAEGDPHRSFRQHKLVSLDWFKGKSTGNHGFYHQI